MEQDIPPVGVGEELVSDLPGTDLSRGLDILKASATSYPAAHSRTLQCTACRRLNVSRSGLSRYEA
jgi:hypothetical protein